jgi:hypothetical protein
MASYMDAQTSRRDALLVSERQLKYAMGVEAGVELASQKRLKISTKSLLLPWSERMYESNALWTT